MNHNFKLISGAYTNIELASISAANSLNIKCHGNIQQFSYKMGKYFENFHISLTHANKDMTNIKSSDLILFFKISQDDHNESMNNSSLNFIINKRYFNSPFDPNSPIDFIDKYKQCILITDFSLQNSQQILSSIVNTILLLKPTSLMITGTCDHSCEKILPNFFSSLFSQILQ